MLRVAICDDVPEDLSLLHNAIESLNLPPEIEKLCCKSFLHADDLLEHIDQNGGFDVYFLDVLMPQTSGISLGHAIRRRQEACEIIYISNSREYAIAAFGVEALRYIVKPPDTAELSDALSRAHSRIAQSREAPSITKKTDRGVVRLRLQDIILIENRKNYQYIQTLQGEIYALHEKLSTLYQELADDGRFIMPRHSYIVNMDYVVRIDKACIHLEGGLLVPLVKNSYSRIKQAFFDHMFQGDV